MEVDRINGCLILLRGNIPVKEFSVDKIMFWKELEIRYLGG